MRAVPAASLAILLLLTAPIGLANHDGSTDAAKDVSFDSRSGNEWWVQVHLSGAAATSVVGVEAQDTGGSWVTLTKRSWGDWAASFHVEPGHEVRFVAAFGDGTHVTSCWMTHPGGEPTVCDDAGDDDGGDDGGDAGAFTFRPKGGNEWWVQVSVTPHPAAVQAMDTNGAWTALEKKSWGDWAASFRVEPGHEVRFRAHSGDGAWSTSCWFTHPGGAPTTCDESGDNDDDGGSGGDANFTATFRTKGGNEWWVEAFVTADAPLAGVHARVLGDDAWRTLTKRAWGAWAASFHVSDGSLVEFRATAADGRTDVSDDVYRWPSGAAEPRADEGDAAWPVEGSYLHYLLDAGESLPGYHERTTLWLNYTYAGGRWVGTCEGWYEEENPSGEERERLVRNVTAPPPTGPRDVQLGEGVDVELPSCGDRGASSALFYVDGRSLDPGYHGEPFRKEGAPIEIPVWRASWEDDGCPCQWRDARWHWDTGITVDWISSYRYSYASGHLVDTDAPVAEEDTSEPPTPAWPREGSFVEYEVLLSSEFNDAIEQQRVRFTFIGGAWQAACGDRTTDAAPPMGPTDTTAGASVRPTEAPACRITPPAVAVQGTFPEDTTRNGAPHRAEVWWGDEFAGKGGDEDAWWDTATGLLLRWEDHGGYYQGDAGRLLDTDAPLSSG